LGLNKIADPTQIPDKRKFLVFFSLGNESHI